MRCCNSGPNFQGKELSYTKATVVKMKIVIVEDNETIRTELSTFLKKYGYETDTPGDFSNIVPYILNSGAHLVLLDIGLPVYDGYYICRELRKSSTMPVIVVTSRDSEMDELMSMNLGADDFITKPYNLQILLARISSVLKRTYQQEPPQELVCKGLTLSLSRSVAVYGGKEAELTKNEMRILYLLMKNENSILPRDELINELWQSDEFIDDNTLTVNMNRLRKKLASLGLEDYITTKRGLGYLV